MAAIRFLLNPAGGGGRARRQEPLLARLAAESGAALEVSESPEDLTARARRAAEEGVERLVVAGGDGTQNLALQGLVGTSCAHIPLPLGSGNDIAASLGLVGKELEPLVRRALEAPLRRIDVARAGGRYYAAIAGVGFDSAANETANRVKHFRGPWIYLYAVGHTLATFRAPRFEITFEGGRFEGRALLTAAANGPR
ncbi:MAG TPA: diacylglycerol kinase family protein, partial [Thermoanaerobaculia bacterium]|nr:diacylglycerol kinase family protein [Thermoanaerobaculia bacterium]